MQSGAAKSSSTASSRPSKILLFDRRYGFVLDEWTEPSQEALSGGRGMFCIVPLAKTLFDKASESINIVASNTLKVLERPELLSPKVVQATLSDQVHKIAASVKQTGSILMATKRNESISSSSHISAEEHSGSNAE
ncbi:hypothetical protein ACJIZ3_019159 [Penstemon smallii]|uniref:Uncharacterized protein n=1 Tax=Penstemon smallii TaxID=265156 RepID=A0ABD3T0D9_9LAMI